MSAVITTVDELRSLVGREIYVGGWLEITQERVNRFAAATGDFQHIHGDSERVKDTFFGGVVAHSFLTLSLIAGLYGPRPEAPERNVTLNLGGALEVNYGVNTARFPAPAFVGTRIRLRSTLLAVDDIAGGVQLTTRETIEIEGEDKPACVAECLGRTYW